MNPKTSSDDSLRWARNDINEAIRANPDSDNIYRYLSLRREIDEELYRREVKRIHRRAMSGAVCVDPLTVHVRSRRLVRARNNAAWRRRQYIDAAFSLGFDRAHGR